MRLDIKPSTTSEDLSPFEGKKVLLDCYLTGSFEGILQINNADFLSITIKGDEDHGDADFHYGEGFLTPFEGYDPDKDFDTLYLLYDTSDPQGMADLLKDTKEAVDEMFANFIGDDSVHPDVIDDIKQLISQIPTVQP